VKISPLAWYNAIELEITKKYADSLVVFVYITNANIPVKAKKAKECKNLLIIEQSCADEYFAPIILPYFTTVKGQENDN